MNEQSLLSPPVEATTKPLLEVICFPAGVAEQESWVKSFIKKNPWTSECSHVGSSIVISQNGKEIELARKRIDIPINNLLHATYYHFAAFAVINGERHKITDSDYLCFGLEDFKTHIDKTALFFRLHAIELNILAV